MGLSIGEAKESELVGIAWLVPGTTEDSMGCGCFHCHAKHNSRYASAVPRPLVSNASMMYGWRWSY